MPPEPYPGEKLDQSNSPDQPAPEADPYWVAEMERSKQQSEFDRRERAVGAALAFRRDGPVSVDDVIADAVRILKFISGAE